MASYRVYVENAAKAEIRALPGHVYVHAHRIEIPWASKRAPDRGG